EYIEKENKIEEEITRMSTKLVPLRKGYIHEPILLKNGDILFLSETDNYLFNIKINKIEKINSFEYWRRNFSTIELPNGNVLIVGGSCGNSESHYPYNEVEMFK
ncbi:MAG: hypothetical protein K6C94_07230, partial [Candidatus Gastranaerophilales bacterium]|nr:hypothetical protein [Candidatus Gastranaerophilales bacterium]